VRILPVRVNGDPGLRTDTASGPRGVVAFELAEGAIVGIRILVNPDKLRHLTRMEANSRC
jgi:hypothetical protein